jgi:hypothetical protein
MRKKYIFFLSFSPGRKRKEKKKKRKEKALGGECALTSSAEDWRIITVRMAKMYEVVDE